MWHNLHKLWNQCPPIETDTVCKEYACDLIIKKGLFTAK